MLGLLSGSILSIAESKFGIPYPKWAGTSGYFPTIIFLANWCKLWALNGGCRALISYNKTPNDQISDLKLYGFDYIISGDR